MNVFIYPHLHNDLVSTYSDGALSKTKTLEQVEAMHRKAISFSENVLQDGDLADELDDLSTEEYAQRKGVQIIDNPNKRTPKTMPKPTVAELKDRIEELEEENAELREKVEFIAEIVSDDDGSSEEELEDDDDFEEE